MANIGGTLGALRGSKQERKGYKRAYAILDQLRQTASDVRDQADPFRSYRPEIAQYLSDLVMGRRDVTTDPGYEFARDEAMQATRRQASAQGFGESGNVLTALQDRASGLASQQYGTIIQRLQSLAAATPQNAVSGAQLYGNLESQRIQGQARAQIGSAYAQSRERAATGQLAHETYELGKEIYGGYMTGGLSNLFGGLTGANAGTSYGGSGGGGFNMFGGK